MKKNIRNTIFIALLPFCLLLFTEGCKKASDTTVQEQSNGDLMLKGSVLNATTHAGIANARVYFSGQTMLTTDADGNYKLNCKTTGCGSFDVRVMADGFGYGFASATIGSNAAMVNTILLTPLNAPVSIGSTGGTLSISDPESLTAGSKTILTIAAGTFSNNTSISLTRFTGIEVPGYAPVNTLNLCAVNLSPASALPGKALELTFALPFTDAGIDNLPLMKYNFETNVWDMVAGVQAQVNHALNTATVEVASFGTYSLAVAGSFSESNGANGSATTLKLDPSLSTIDFSYLAKNTYPGGTPASISLSYLKNIASQNTRLNGARIRFDDNTLYTFNYIGSKPDSLAPVKSTMAGFYRWVPKVSYAEQEMPMNTILHGVSVTGIIIKNVYSPLSGYEYVHDQGGGGK
ncbi:MAG: hypothetical protein WCK09_09515 [Bacteroidota bacterium]